ncbi:MAG: phage tail tape measure protein [Treponema sp.]|nr:phage tail tape measure protein [Treponema sp.]
MASKYAMETVFSLIDKVSRPLDKIGIKSKTVTKKLQKDFVAAQKRLDNFGKAIVKWGKRAALAAAAAVTAWAGLGVKNALTLADTMAKIGHAANITGPPLEQLQKDLTNVANSAGLAVNELAEIANTSILSGIAAESAAEFSSIVARTARITDASSDQIVDGLTTVLNAYGMSGDEAARISGMMINANRFGKTSFQDMATGMRNVIPAAAALGVSTEDVFASITTLTAQGLTTRDAMRTMGDSFSAIKRPSREAAALAQRLGIDFSEAALRSKGFAGFMEDIRQRTGGNTQLLETLFGSERTARSMSILTTTGAEAFSEALGIMSNSLETVDTEFARITNTPAERWRMAVNKIQNAGVSLGATILPVVERVIGKVTEIADRLTQVDFSQYTGIIDKVFQKIERLAGGFINILKLAWNFRGVIIAVVAALALYHGALMAVALYTKLYGVIKGVATAATFAFTLATKGSAAALAVLKAGTIAYNIVSKAFAIAAKIATAAQWALNIAMMANPIGLIIAAVIALIAVIVLLAKNWKKITTAIKNNTEKVLAVLTILFFPLGMIISMIREIVSNWENIKNAISGSGLLDAIKNIGASIKNFIQPAIDWFIGVWEKVKASVSGFFRTIGDAIKNFFTPVINWITGVWQAVSNAVVGVFRNIWNAVSTFLEPIFSWISETWQKIVSFFKDSALINAIKVIGGTLLSGILAPIQGLLEILSYIPGLGHLAGRGRDKIQELRNNLTGRGSEANAVPAAAAEELSPLGNTPQVNVTPDVNFADFDLSGAMGPTAGRSGLHGVVDISGGGGTPVIPNYTSGDTPGTYTATATRTPSISVQETINTAASGMTAVLQEILASTRAIEATSVQVLTALNVPATITLTVPQRPINSGRPERERADREDPRNIPPVTSDERMAYSMRETRETLGIEVSASRGTEARIVRRPRSPNIQLVNSGGN